MAVVAKSSSSSLVKDKDFNSIVLIKTYLDCCCCIKYPLTAKKTTEKLCCCRFRIPILFYFIDTEHFIGNQCADQNSNFHLLSVLISQTGGSQAQRSYIKLFLSVGTFSTRNCQKQFLPVVIIYYCEVTSDLEGEQSNQNQQDDKKNEHYEADKEANPLFQGLENGPEVAQGANGVDNRNRIRYISKSRSGSSSGRSR